MITLQMKGQLKQAVFIVAIGIGVTVGGVAVGALVLQPAVAQATKPEAGRMVSGLMKTSTTAVHRMTTATRAVIISTTSTLPGPVRRLALPVLLGAIALTGFTLTGLSYFRSRQADRPSASIARPQSGGKSAAKLNGNRTPKAVQALADSGAEPSEIAWRTGLSLDAVAMLLFINPTSRQLRPPTA